MTIGSILKQLRNNYKFSIEEIAEFLDITTFELKLIEQNKKMLTVSQLEVLSDLYLVNDEYILCGEDSSIHLKDYYQQDLDVNTTYQINKVLKNIDFLESIN